MNIFKIFDLVTRFYALKAQFDQIKKGEFQLPPVVITFLKDSETFFDDSKELIKDLKKF